MACDECRELNSHVFRAADDLINALRVAAEEMNRGVLAREGGGVAPGSPEQEALESVLESGALPGTVQYRFRCEVCGDRFVLAANMGTGEGAWTREGEKP